LYNLHKRLRGTQARTHVLVGDKLCRPEATKNGFGDDIFLIRRTFVNNATVFIIARLSRRRRGRHTGNGTRKITAVAAPRKGPRARFSSSTASGALSRRGLYSDRQRVVRVFSNDRAQRRGEWFGSSGGYFIVFAAFLFTRDRRPYTRSRTIENERTAHRRTRSTWPKSPHNRANPR